METNAGTTDTLKKLQRQWPHRPNECQGLARNTWPRKSSPCNVVPTSLAMIVWFAEWNMPARPLLTLSEWIVWTPTSNFQVRRPVSSSHRPLLFRGSGGKQSCRKGIFSSNLFPCYIQLKQIPYGLHYATCVHTLLLLCPFYSDMTVHQHTSSKSGISELRNAGPTFHCRASR